MARGHSFAVNPAWRVLLTDMGLRPANVLRRAGLAEDLLGRENATLSTDEYFGLWQAMEAESGDPALPLRSGAALSAEVLDFPIFAALCSPDLNTALACIATYKRLVCPMALHVDVGPKATTMELVWLDASLKPPASLVGTEIVFFVQLARIATRTNEEMWKSLEPRMQRRLSELDESATTADRVHAVLLKLLPSGSASIESVSRRAALLRATAPLLAGGRPPQGLLSCQKAS